MFRFAEIRKVLLGALAVVGVVAAGLVAAFMVVWVALAALAGLFIAAVVRRVVPGKRRQAPRAGSEVIEGEFRVERDDRAP